MVEVKEEFNQRCSPSLPAPLRPPVSPQQGWVSRGHGNGEVKRALPSQGAFTGGEPHPYVPLHV